MQSQLKGFSQVGHLPQRKFLHPTSAMTRNNNEKQEVVLDLEEKLSEEATETITKQAQSRS